MGRDVGARLDTFRTKSTATTEMEDCNQHFLLTSSLYAPVKTTRAHAKIQRGLPGFAFPQEQK